MTYFSNSFLKDFFQNVLPNEAFHAKWLHLLDNVKRQDFLYEVRLPYLMHDAAVQKAFQHHLANRKAPPDLRALCWHGIMANTHAFTRDITAEQMEFIDVPSVACEYRKRHLKGWQDISLLSSPPAVKSFPKCFDEAIEKDSPDLFEVIKDLTCYRLSANHVFHLLLNTPQKTHLIRHILSHNGTRTFLRTLLFHSCSSLPPATVKTVLDIISQRYPLLVSTATDYLGNNLLWYSLHQPHRLTCPLAITELTRALIAYGSSPDDRNHLGLSFSDITRWEPVLPNVTPAAKQPAYAVFDLSGESSSSIPCYFTDIPPNPLDSCCKTTELWLKYIPAGTFRMGSADTSEEHLYQQLNEHDIVITRDFYIGVFPVTCKQWQLVTNDNIYFNSEDQLPSRNRTQLWFQDIHDRFLARLIARSGRTFALPTEAQWEYACKGNNTWRPGNYDTYAWTESNSGHSVHPVGLKMPNPQGLYDTIGNCWELCRDIFATGTFYAAADPVQTQSNYSFDLPWVIKGSSAFETFHTPETRFYAHQGSEPDTTFRIIMPV